MVDKHSLTKHYPSLQQPLPAALSEISARVVLVDGDAVSRDRLKNLLLENDVEVVAATDNPRMALDILASQPVEIAIIDVAVPEPGPVVLARRIIELYPASAVLIVTEIQDIEFVSRMLQAGAHGYVLKGAPREELLLALSRLADGQRYYSSEVSYGIISHLLAGGDALSRRPSAAKLGNSPLTKREEEIIRLISNQLTNQEIADKLSISLRTVDTHRRNLLQKLGVKNTAGLVRYAVQHNLVD